jgi:hypothetical protein
MRSLTRVPVWPEVERVVRPQNKGTTLIRHPVVPACGVTIMTIMTIW